MAFEIPQDLHPDLMPLAWLLGRWEGRGHGDYPTIDKFEFGQQIDFSHNGKPFLHFVSQTFLVGEDGKRERPLAMETGFWRPRPDGQLEVVLAHPTGFAEIWYGEIDGAKIEMRTDVVARTVSAKEVTASTTGCTAWSRASCSGPTTWPPRASPSSPTSGPPSSGSSFQTPTSTPPSVVHCGRRSAGCGAPAPDRPGAPDTAAL